MNSILDIDFDYFNQIPDAVLRLKQLLTWAACLVTMVVERHNHAFALWKRKWRTNDIAPSHILHVDEHHDMMDQRQQTNIANFMFHAMCIWPKCRVHWLVEHSIDSPAIWIEDEIWDLFRRRFSHGFHRPVCWPKPDLVSICTSPGFVVPHLATKLMEVVATFRIGNHRKEMPSQAL